MAPTREETAQPRMLAPTQIEAHVTRLTAVREGLRKFEADDGRAAECIRILEVAIISLESKPFSTSAALVQNAATVTSLEDDDHEGPDAVHEDDEGKELELSNDSGGFVGNTEGPDASVEEEAERLAGEASSEVDPPAADEDGTVDSDTPTEGTDPDENETPEKPRTPSSSVADIGGF